MIVLVLVVIFGDTVLARVTKYTNVFPGYSNFSQYARESDDEVRSKIIGGEDAGHIVPYQISLQVKRRPGQRFNKADWAHNCGGSILKPTLVLTAAHCVTR